MSKTLRQSFAGWYSSAENPLCNASDAAQYFTRDALYAAYKAGAIEWFKTKLRDDIPENIFV